jgi:hypothetical protein
MLARRERHQIELLQLDISVVIVRRQRLLEPCDPMLGHLRRQPFHLPPANNSGRPCATR